MSEKILKNYNLTDNVQTVWGSCSTNAACNPSFSLYCNMTGQYTNLNSNKEGTCVCKPYNYWIGGTIGCTPQLTYNTQCTNPTPATVLDSQCLDQTGLYCDSISGMCICQSNYYWSSTSSKCSKIISYLKLYSFN